MNQPMTQVVQKGWLYRVHRHSSKSRFRTRGLSWVSCDQCVMTNWLCLRPEICWRCCRRACLVKDCEGLSASGDYDRDQKSVWAECFEPVDGDRRGCLPTSLQWRGSTVPGSEPLCGHQQKGTQGQRNGWSSITCCGSQRVQWESTFSRWTVKKTTMLDFGCSCGCLLLRIETSWPSAWPTWSNSLA